MEMIIVMLFFSVSGAVCVQLFTKAHLISESSINLNKATLYAQSVAELFQGYDGDVDEMGKDTALPSIVIGDSDNPDYNRLLILFDKDWNLLQSPAVDISSGTAAFILIADIEKMQAAAVYADTEFASKLSDDQMAIKCVINVLDVRNEDSITQSTNVINGTSIYTLETDIYIGHE